MTDNFIYLDIITFFACRKTAIYRYISYYSSKYSNMLLIFLVKNGRLILCVGAQSISRKH